jgi:hypothetical protein
MSIVCQRLFYRSRGVALSPLIDSFLGSGSLYIVNSTSPTRRFGCEEHRCRRGHSSSAHVGANHRFGILDANRNGHKHPSTSSHAMSTALKEEHSARPSIHPTIESIRSVRKSYDPSVSVGFVPTMGALHEGNDRFE